MQRKTKFTFHDVSTALQTAQAYAKGSHGQWFTTLNAGNVRIETTDSTDDTLQLNDCQIVMERGEIACGLLGVRPATYFVLYAPATTHGPDGVADFGLTMWGSYQDLRSVLSALYLDFAEQWLHDMQIAIDYADIVNRDII
jgi:hypothetical protein